MKQLVPILLNQTASTSPSRQIRQKRIIHTMSIYKYLVAYVCIAIVMSLTSCNSNSKNPQSTSSSSPTQSSSESPSAVNTNTEIIGIEKIKPAPGTGNVQGKVLYNSKPAKDIEVKLCEEFEQFIGGCSKQIYKARTDEQGEYVITNVKPKVYQSLLVRVFNTKGYIFSTSGILKTSQYEVSQDKTLFVSPTNIYKNDLNLINPKAGGKVSAKNLELKWKPYPDASYYKIRLSSDVANTGASVYINERIDGTSFSSTKPLGKGVYSWQVEAYNNSDQKLSESSNDIKFTIVDSTTP